MVPRRAAGDPADAGAIAPGGGTHVGLPRARPARGHRRGHPAGTQPRRAAGRTRIAAARAARRHAALADGGQRHAGRADVHAAAERTGRLEGALRDAGAQHAGAAAAGFRPGAAHAGGDRALGDARPPARDGIDDLARTDGGHDVLGARRQRLDANYVAPAAPAPGAPRRRASRGRCCPTGAPTALPRHAGSAAASPARRATTSSPARPSIARPPRCCAWARARARKSAASRCTGPTIRARRPRPPATGAGSSPTCCARRRRLASAARQYAQLGIAMSDAFVATWKISSSSTCCGRHLHPARARCELGAADDGDAALPRIPLGPLGFSPARPPRCWSASTAATPRSRTASRNDRGWGP